MADKTIGALPKASQLDDESLLVMEQQGAAMALTGALVKQFVREKVDQYAVDAKADADRAEAAANSVANMTVEAQTLASGQSATVQKSIKSGVVNLAFGLPAGAPGPVGPTGKDGPPGPPGPTGSGLTILGYYDTADALQDAVAAPEAGDAYGVGASAPYHIYIYDGVSGTWVDNGEVTGVEGGSGVPDGGKAGQALLKNSDADKDVAWRDIPSAADAVTVPGGGALEMSAELGDPPYKIRFTEEPDEDITAENVSYDNTATGMKAGNVQAAVDELFTSVSDGKATVASAITDKGVPTAADAAFQTMADNIAKLGGSDTSDATATPGDILSPKTAYVAGGKIEGLIPSLAAQTITPGTEDQTIANGQYLSGTQTIKGDANLVSSNIRQGVTLFGVNGAMTSEFKATLTVTVDTGAVVTATHTDGSEVTALSQTGSVTLDLPIEGEWTVTAVRGITQYNAVVITVSSSYTASLTAELHVEYYGSGTALDKGRYGLAAARASDYVLFGGGATENYGKEFDAYYGTDAYDKNLSKVSGPLFDAYNSRRAYLAACSVGEYALFAGGMSKSGQFTDYRTVYAFNASLTKSTPDVLSISRSFLAGTSIGNYALFGGGGADYRPYQPGLSERDPTSLSNVDAYDQNLTHTTPAVLTLPANKLAAASNANYAIFGGGTGVKAVTAYDSSLTRTTPASLSIARHDLAAVNAGNYVLFAGGNTGSGYTNVVDAYDMFLTRTTPTPLSVARSTLAGASVSVCGLFAGGRDGSNFYNTADTYDPYLVRMDVTGLGVRRGSLAAVSIENFALFGGGFNYNYDTDAIDAVDIYRFV